jgi:hypothetical protein
VPTARQLGILVAAVAGAVVVVVVLQVRGTGDYAAHGVIAGDNPAPALAALIHGDFSRLLTEQPLMGLASILLRAPLVALTSLAGGSQLTSYRLGAIVCLLPVAGLFGWLAAGTALSPRTRIAGGLAAALVLIAPPTWNALWSGHPEEVLAAVLATACVIAAKRQSGDAAALLLGLAIGTKEWAMIAALPALLALDSGRLRAIVIAGSTALALSAPAILDPGAFAARNHAVFGTHLSNQFSAWWSLGARLGVPHGVATVTKLPFGLTRSFASLVPLALAVAMLLWRFRTQQRPELDPLALLAALALVRCLADPLPLSYYYVPVVLALAAYEVTTLARPPIVAALAVAVQGTLFGRALDPGVVNVLVCLFAVALFYYLTGGRRSFRARRAARSLPV